MDGPLVGAHEGWFVIEQGERLNSELVDLCQGDDVVAVEVDPVPEVQQLLLVLDDALDLLLKLIELLEALLADVVRVRRLVPTSLPHDLPTMGARKDVGVKGGVRRRGPLRFLTYAQNSTKRTLPPW